MRSLLLAGLTFLAMVATACGGNDRSSLDETDGGTDAAQVLLSAVPAPSSLTETESTVKTPAERRSCRSVAAEGEATISGRRLVETTQGKREYLLYRPAGPSSDTPLPLVLNFHGRGSDADTQQRYSGLIPVAERVGFIVVTPEGTGSPRAWSAGATPTGEVDDVAYVRLLLDAVEREICVDATRIYATGFSNGAFMASKVACKLGDRIAAFAAVAGLHGPGEGCTKAVPALAIHGTKDGLVPFEKGMVRHAYAYNGARAETKAWAAQNGCTSTMMTEKLSPTVTRESFTTGQAPVVLYVLSGGGHTWPGAPEIPGLGSTVREVNAAETIWAFFSSYRRAA